MSDFGNFFSGFASSYVAQTQEQKDFERQEMIRQAEFIRQKSLKELGIQAQARENALNREQQARQFEAEDERWRASHDIAKRQLALQEAEAERSAKWREEDRAIAKEDRQRQLAWEEEDRAAKKEISDLTKRKLEAELATMEQKLTPEYQEALRDKKIREEIYDLAGELMKKREDMTYKEALKEATGVVIGSELSASMSKGGGQPALGPEPPRPKSEEEKTYAALTSETDDPSKKRYAKAVARNITQAKANKNKKSGKSEDFAMAEFRKVMSDPASTREEKIRAAKAAGLKPTRSKKTAQNMDDYVYIP